MKIVAAGGGSGGHVTPVLTVINELNKADPSLESWFITDRGYEKQAAALMRQAARPVNFKAIYAGKLRRYHGQSWLDRLLDVPTNAKNLRDVLYLGIGFLQSLSLLRRERPDAVFTKGGFVCVPVGLAAACLKIPLIIHDSDTIPGLSNRILARYAQVIATGAPLENYRYPKAKSHYVGIPINPVFKPISGHERKNYKKVLGLDPDLPLVFVTGGGTGSELINDMIADNVVKLTHKAQVLHLTGAGKATHAKTIAKDYPRYHVKEFLDSDMPNAILAADVVVTRAGATTLLEMAAAGKACIIVPNPFLTGGHQLKNAKVYEETDAAVVLDEKVLKTNHGKLAEAITALLSDHERLAAHSKAIVSLAKPEAAKELAKLIISAAEQKR